MRSLYILAQSIASNIRPFRRSVMIFNIRGLSKQPDNQINYILLFLQEKCKICAYIKHYTRTVNALGYRNKFNVVWVLTVLVRDQNILYYLDTHPPQCPHLG